MPNNPTQNQGQQGQFDPKKGQQQGREEEKQRDQQNRDKKPSGNY